MTTTGPLTLGDTRETADEITSITPQPDQMTEIPGDQGDHQRADYLPPLSPIVFSLARLGETRR